jgi:predicted DCC family thiol-disulfide oxidoreductase YuxK
MHQIIFFDGVCNLCNFFVQLILPYDTKKVFQFASLQSKTYQKILQVYSSSDLLLPSSSSPSTIVLFDGERFYLQSSAIFQILKHLSGWLHIFYIFRFLPIWFTNAVYNWIAGNRYKIFGRSDTCLVPSVELKNRFLD